MDGFEAIAQLEACCCYCRPRIEVEGEKERERERDGERAIEHTRNLSGKEAHWVGRWQDSRSVSSSLVLCLSVAHSAIRLMRSGSVVCLSACLSVCQTD